MAVVERAQQRVHRTPPPAATARCGTGSMPKPPSGWQRLSRRTASQLPRSRAVDLERFDRVLRARRVRSGRVTVGAARELLVDVDRAPAIRAGGPDRSRRRSPVRRGRRRSRGTCRAVSRTRSSPPRARRRRGRRAGNERAATRPATTARSRRRTRLRATASTDAAADGVGDARRSVGSARERRSRSGLPARRRPAASARNVARSRTRQIRPRGGRGPWPDADGATARPAAVRMRRRKPCFFFRFRLFGWNVLFTHGLLEARAEGMGPGGGAADLDWRRRRASGTGARRRTCSVRLDRRRRNPALSRPRVWGTLPRAPFRDGGRRRRLWASRGAGNVRSPTTGRPRARNFPVRTPGRTRPRSRRSTTDASPHLWTAPVDNSGEPRMGTPAADDLWDQGRGRRARPALRGHVEHVVPRRPRASTSRATPSCSACPSSRRRRAHPHELPRAPRRRHPRLTGVTVTRRAARRHRAPAESWSRSTASPSPPAPAATTDERSAGARSRRRRGPAPVAR